VRFCRRYPRIELVLAVVALFDPPRDILVLGTSGNRSTLIDAATPARACATSRVWARPVSSLSSTMSTGRPTNQQLSSGVQAFGISPPGLQVAT
jgi:hypothetical protein